MRSFFKLLFFFIIALTISVGTVYATDELLDDFDDGDDATYWGGGTWGGCHVDSFGDRAHDSSIQHLPNSGRSLRIWWSSVDGADEWGGGCINNLNVDVSTYNAVSFWIYTPNPNTKTGIIIQDTDAAGGEVACLNLYDYLQTGTSVWQNCIIPLAAFKRDQSALDFTIKELKFFSYYDLGHDAAGTIYIDDISFCVLEHAPARSISYSGDDKGISGTPDIEGDTIIFYDQAGSSTTTNEVNVRVSTTYASAWASTPSDGSGNKNTSVYTAYQIRNDGNIADIMSLSTAALSGYPHGGEAWVPVLIWDKDKSGTFTAGDIANYDTIGLIPDSTYFFLVKVDIPSDAAFGSSSTVKITAKTNNGSGANDNWPAGSDNDTIVDTFTVTCQAPNITIYKSTNVATAKPVTENILVTLTYENDGNQAATVFMVTEALPFNTYLTADPGAGSADTIQFYVGSAWQGAYSATATKIRWIDNSVPASSGALTLNYTIRAR